MALKELSPENIRLACKSDVLDCSSSAEIPPLDAIIGQDRAIRALRFGLDIKKKGFNIYVAGQPGTGRTTAVKDYLEKVAKVKQVPNDWVYVNNFKNSYEPKSIKLLPGKAIEFQKDIREFIDEAKRAIPKALQSDDYISKQENMVKVADEQKKNLINQLNIEAQKANFTIQVSQVGITLTPVIGGRPINEQEYAALNPNLKNEFDKTRVDLESRLQKAMKQIAELNKTTRDALSKLANNTIHYALGFLISELLKKYNEMPEILSFLKDIQDDILNNVDMFSGKAEQQSPPGAPQPSWMKDLPFRRYEVNVLVDNSDLKGAPVIFDENPTYVNLFGRIEKEAQFGTLSTDFTLIKSGSLHKANGGYLVLPVEEIAKNLLSYDALKRSLKSEKITISDAGEKFGFITTKTLTPQPIPLNVKIVMIGDPSLYQLLYSYDNDFKGHFKVKAQFDTTIDRNEENMKRYASFVCTVCSKENLLHLDPSGISKIIEFGSRLANDQKKLSTRFADVADIIREADFYANQEGSNYIKDVHIVKSIDEKKYRSNLIQEKIKEMISRGIILIDTSEERVGQINGLSVLSLGDFAFGSPSRITASVGLGKDGVVDIERESKLGGPTHTKGVLILSGYLANKYSSDAPLSLSARLVFEQSYQGVDGDSASSTEIYAILSALSELPIKQNFAVTGSVNQYGKVQAIGGVNEKIEGFFEVCKAKGMKGNEGVLIPESNVQNLMLKEEVVDAVKQGKFHIFPVHHIDDGIELLTGVKAGNKNKEGQFEPNTVNYLVDNKLKEMAEKMAKFSDPQDK